MQYLSFITRPPAFDDEDKNLSASLLHFILIATTLANIAALIARPILLVGETLGPVSAYIVIFLVQISLFVLMRSGRVRLSGLLLAVFLWLIIALGAYTNTGILNPMYGAQTVVIVAAGLLINEWAALGFALVSSAFGLWLAEIAEAGKYIAAVGTITVQQTWANDTTAFILTGLLLFLSLRTIRDARKRVLEQTRIRRQSDERYRSLVKTAPDTIFTLDRNHRVTFMSRSSLRPMESVIGRPVYEFLNPDSRDPYRTAMNRVLELGSTEQIEVQNVQPGEQSGWYLIRFAPVWEDKTVVEVTAISTNITEQKRAADALQASEVQYRLLFAANPQPMFVTDLQTLRFLDVNDAAVNHYGYSRDEFLTLRVSDLRADEAAVIQQQARAVREQPSDHQSGGIVQHRKKDDSIIWVEMSYHRLNYNGHDAVVSAARDLTRRLRAEEALRASEEQYRQLFESNPHPMFVSDLEERKMLAVNDAALAKFGYTRDEFVGLKTSDLLAPQDYVLATERLERSKRGDSPFIAPTINQLVKKDGSFITVEAAAHQLNYQSHKAVLTVAYDLTERLQAETAVRESEARLRARIESAMDAILTIDAHQDIVQFNAAAESMFRISADEIIGQPIETLIPQRFRNIHGGHIQNFGQTGVTNRHMGALGSISGLRADGEEFPIEASISQFDVGTGKYYSIILRDITERKLAENEIRRSEELFSTIIQSVPVAIGIISLTTGQTLTVNDYMLKLTGFDADQILGRPVPEAPYWVQPEQWQRFAQPVQEGQSTSGIEMEWRTQSGELLTMLGSATEVDIHGEPCILGLALNITERKHAERIRLQVYREREVLEVKERFISRMSHEFRTPLAVILFTNELMRMYYDRMSPEQREEHFQNVEEQVQYVTDLLDSVLTLSKERAGKMPFNPVSMNLVRFCEKLYEQIQATDHSQHEFSFVADQAISEIQGDEKLLQHILINLLSNAIKYTPEGGQVRFEVRREGEGAMIQVSDQGIGIPEEDQKHLFEPFYRASNTHTIEGTGLGLAIVKESVEIHRGTITCESKPGQGTTFAIYLPVAVEASA